MTTPPDRTFTADFKTFFLRGLAVLLPSILTLWIVVKGYQFVNSSIAQPINGGFQLMLIQIAPHWPPLDEFEPFRPLPEEIEAERRLRGVRAGDTSRDARIFNDLRRRRLREWWDDRWYMDLLGIVIALIVVYITGRLVGGFLGRHIHRRVEVLITSLPVFKQVYPYVKQIVDFLFAGDRPIKFSRVVAAEYPRKGIWSVGFMTGPTLKSVATRAGDSVTVFVPSSPTPFTGYTITVRRDEIIDLPISVEEAIRFAVSGGVLVPDHQRIEDWLPGGLAAVRPKDDEPPPAPGDGPVTTQ